MNELQKTRREAIFKMQDFVSQLDQYEPEINNYFAKGVYAREMKLKAGALIVGKIHKHQHLCIVSYGKSLVANDRKSEMIEGPCTFISYPGVKRVIQAITDTMWTTIHVTDKTDLAEIEKDMIAETYDEVNI